MYNYFVYLLRYVKENNFQNRHMYLHYAANRKHLVTSCES